MYRIPFGSRLGYPAECPFTGQNNPRSAVRIERRETQMFLPIPFLGLFKLGKVGRAAFPAARGIALVARALAYNAPPMSFRRFWQPYLDEGQAIRLAVPPWGVVMMYVCFGVEWLWLHRVRLVRIGMNSVEVRFASQGYAEEFCRLNELHCQTKPTPKRATPIMVNDVR